MNRFLSVLVMVGAGLSLGCQSYPEGVRIMCDAPNRAEMARVEPEYRLKVIAEYVEDAVSNGRAEALFEGLAVLSVTDKLAAVEAARKEAKLTQCGLSDELRNLAKESAEQDSRTRP